MSEYDFLHFPAEAVQVDPLSLARLPASARHVFAVVRDHGPLTHAELQDHTGIPARTIRFAVKRLREEHLVDTRSSLRDGRTCYIFVDRSRIGRDAIQDARARAFAAAARGEKVIEAA